MESSTTHKDCKQCSHDILVPGQWCYMFKDKPEKLPCGQHDKFASIRKVTGEAIKKNPALLMGIVMKEMDNV